MIRRRVGNEFWLLSQHDHALLSGELSRHFGDGRFAKPDPFDPVITGISMHDAGWPIHDESPTLNKDRLPLDVFEMTPKLGFAVWGQSARRAAERDPYAGLLVSMHGLTLSVLATQQVFDNEQFDLNDARVRFDINKFQHSQIELGESLRQKLGLRTDIPLHCGISKNSTDPMEQQLEFNFRLLQAMDKLSLCLCCTKPPFAEIEPLPHHPGQISTPLRVSRPEPETLLVAPWPFDVERIEVSFPYRRVGALPFADEAEFRDAFNTAAIERFGCSVSPG